MAEASTLRPDFVPFARTIHALNKVSRTIQDERRKAVHREDATGVPAPHAMPEFDFSAFASSSEIPFNFEDSNQPLGFIRALENDFTSRNRNEGWWDVGADLTGT
jgi:hypothetical protein